MLLNISNLEQLTKSIFIQQSGRGENSGNWDELVTKILSN